MYSGYTFDEELQYALLDRYTWPALIGNLVDQIIRSYGNLEMDQTVLSAAKCLEKIPYERLMVSEKLDILKFLVDMFLPIPVIRKGLDNPGHVPEEDFCRVYACRIHHDSFSNKLTHILQPKQMPAGW